MEGIILTTKSELDNYIQNAVSAAFVSNLSRIKETSKSKNFYSRHEAAQELNCSVSTIDRMIRDGELSKKKIRSKTVVPAFQVQAIKDKMLAA